MINSWRIRAKVGLVVVFALLVACLAYVRDGAMAPITLIAIVADCVALVWLVGA